MKHKALFYLTCTGISLLMPLAALAADKQAPTGPSLPLPDAPFRGTIGESYATSSADLHRARTAPAGSPNIIVVMTDDVGFGAASTFGGPIPTPNLDRLAARGLVYNRFHTTAMCSPTRAALLTGRNHHSVHNGIVANLTTGFPGYDNQLPKSAATLAEVLRQYGWNTAMIGKHHNAPEDQVSPQGPFDLWPTGLGFEYFYGFMAAETNQFDPVLYRGITRSVKPGERTLPAGEVLEKNLTDDAIAWLRDQKSVNPDKPFFLYYAAPSNHAPLQVPPEWSAKFKGKFDAGWNVLRDGIAARQKAMGIISRSTRMAPMPAEVPAWNTLGPDEKRIAARWMEVYAGMLAYQDAQFGRLLDEMERMGQADNTLVIFIEGDNGSALEGGVLGRVNPMGAYANAVNETVDYQVSMIDQYGGPETTGNYGFGWALALNAPNPYGKQYASHLGGLRNGMVISWPDRIKPRGIRTQFTHVNDVMPTVLDLLKIQAPASVNGVAQQPVDGVSFAYSFDAPAAPERHDTQYFEMMGNQAIYHKGWWAGTTPVRLPWGKITTSDIDPARYNWELYNLDTDPAQSTDLAARNPAKLAELKALFAREAGANAVYPLDDRLTMARFLAAAPRPRARYTYWGAGISIPAVNAAPLLSVPFTISASLDLPAVPVSGAIVALGSKFAGWSFHVVDGVPAATIAASQLPGDQYTVTARKALPAGKVTLEFQFDRESGVNAGGEMIIRANGEETGRGPIRRTISKLVEQTDTFDVGFDADTPVVEGPASAPFSGTIDRVDVMPVLPSRPAPAASPTAAPAQ